MRRTHRYQTPLPRYRSDARLQRQRSPSRYIDELTMSGVLESDSLAWTSASSCVDMLTGSRPAERRRATVRSWVTSRRADSYDESDEVVSATICWRSKAPSRPTPMLVSSQGATSSYCP